MLQFADLDKRFQHIDLADDFTVLDMALPENQIVNYISTAYAYHHVLNKTLLPVETLQRLLDVIGKCCDNLVLARCSKFCRNCFSE